jgi:glutaredoxin 2
MSEQVHNDRAEGLVEGLALYQYAGCPFCLRVRMAIDELGVEIELRDTLVDPEHERSLVEATGRRTVPVLRIEEDDGQVRWMPESADIVAYLRERFG